MITFAVEVRKCPHKKIEFGCEGCIGKERTKALEAFSLNSENDPLCSRCGQTCYPVSGNRTTMVVRYECGACPNNEMVFVR